MVKEVCQARHVLPTSVERRVAQEEVVKIMDDPSDGEERRGDPKEGIGKGVENEGRGAKTEGKTGVEEE